MIPNLYKKTPVIILGLNSETEQLAELISKSFPDKRPIAFIENSDQIDQLSQLPVYRDQRKAIYWAIRLGVKHFFTLKDPSSSSLLHEIKSLSPSYCIRLTYIKDGKVQLAQRYPLDDPYNLIIKRSFDIFFSLGVIVFLLSWLYPILALLIKLESRGSILFRQCRSGYNGEPFDCFKFRTMKLNKSANKEQAKRNDTRITRIGKLLRKTSLDELPQFINVLRGEMSVVGPRPHMMKHTYEYSSKIDHYMNRHYVYPGVTGWSQANGWRGEITNNDQLHRRIQGDIWYLENWSLMLDLKIIWYTIKKVVQGDVQAY
jgi:putative colanic acid biosynthesis UDP-glucose lipid carrier transferase